MLFICFPNSILLLAFSVVFLSFCPRPYQNRSATHPLRASAVEHYCQFTHAHTLWVLRMPAQSHLTLWVYFMYTNHTHPIVHKKSISMQLFIFPMLSCGYSSPDLFLSCWLRSLSEDAMHPLQGLCWSELKGISETSFSAVIITLCHYYI